MSDSLHVRILSDLSDLLCERRRVQTEPDDSFGGWDETETLGKLKPRPVIESPTRFMKQTLEPLVKSTSKLTPRLSKPQFQPLKLERPVSTLLFPDTQIAVMSSTRRIRRVPTESEIRVKPHFKPKIVSLKTMSTREVKQIVTVNSRGIPPIHTSRNRVLTSGLRDEVYSLPSIVTKKVIRRVESRTPTV